jgi:cytochrome c
MSTTNSPKGNIFDGVEFEEKRCCCLCKQDDPIDQKSSKESQEDLYVRELLAGAELYAQALGMCMVICAS